jgi:hypothetical protein
MVVIVVGRDVLCIPYVYIAARFSAVGSIPEEVIGPSFFLFNLSNISSNLLPWG